MRYVSPSAAGLFSANDSLYMTLAAFIDPATLARGTNLMQSKAAGSANTPLLTQSQQMQPAPPIHQPPNLVAGSPQYGQPGAVYVYPHYMPYQQWMMAARQQQHPPSPPLNFVVQDGNRMKVAKENAKNYEAMTGPHLAAQTVFRMPVHDSGVERFINLLSNADDLVASWNSAIMSVMYTGSFAAAADLNSRELPRLFEKVPSLRALKFSSEICDTIYSMFIDLVAEELSPHARDIIKKTRAEDVGRFSGFRGANVVSGSLDLLNRVKGAFSRIEPSPTAIDDVEDDFLKAFERARETSSSSSRRNDKSGSTAPVTTRLSDFAQFFKQFPKALFTQDLIDRIKKIPLYKKTMHIQEIEHAFLLLSSAANRAMIQFSKLTRIPNVDYQGVNTNIIHFWLASLRYEQNRWIQEAYPKLNNEQLETRATFDISRSHEPLRDRYLGSKIDPPISYARITPLDSWTRATEYQKSFKELPYFHLFKGLPIPLVKTTERGK